ncbi:MAG: DUF2461 domain-containing protein [Hyphomicrobiales bacterium]
MSSFSGFPPETFAFLKGLAKTNSKEWFEQHRADYELYDLAPAKAFVEALGPRLKKIAKDAQAEARVNGSIFRINRDVRFSKDKRPYKTTLDMWFWQGAQRSWENTGFYVRLRPDGFLAGAGLFEFTPEQLKRYRAAVLDEKAGASLVKTLSRIEGLALNEPERKQVPRGFPSDHPRAELLKRNGLYCSHDAPLPKAIHTAAFVDLCVDIFARALSLNDWLKAHVVKG